MSEVHLPSCRSHRPRSELTACALIRFEEIDKNSNGFLEPAELEDALQSSDFDGNHAAMVSTLRAVISDFDDFSNDEIFRESLGITVSDLIAFDRVRAENPDHPTVRKVNGSYAYAKKKIGAQNRSLYDASGTLDVEAVHQGQVGSCTVVAALIAALVRDEAEVRSWIVPHPRRSNEFVVTFPGAPGSMVIPNLTDGEVATFSSAGANGLWLGLLEKATGEASRRGRYVFYSHSAVSEFDQRTWLRFGVQLYTGNPVDVDRFMFSSLEATRSKLQTAFSRGALVTAAAAELSRRDRNLDGLPLSHAYAVIGYDSSTDMLTLRNPWGSNRGPFHNVFSMNTDAFFESFHHAAYEQIP